MSSTDSSVIKSTISRESAKAKQDAFSRFRGTLSSSFSKSRSSQNRRVIFDLDSNAIHALPPMESTEKDRLYLTYKDKVSIADDVEETCYRFGDSDTVHPYIQRLDSVWEKCALVNAEALELSDEELLELVNSKGRGMEKKLLADMKRHRDYVVKQVLDSQKSMKMLPVGNDQRAKLLKNRYKKLTARSKVFALALANGDQLVSTAVLGNTVAATSA